MTLTATDSSGDTETLLACFPLDGLSRKTEGPTTESLSGNTQGLDPQNPTRQAVPLLAELGTAPLTPPSGNHAVIVLPKPCLTSLSSLLPCLTP